MSLRKPMIGYTLSSKNDISIRTAMIPKTISSKNKYFSKETNDLGKEKTKPKGKGAKGARGGAGPGPPR